MPPFLLLLLHVTVCVSVSVCLRLVLQPVGEAEAGRWAAFLAGLDLGARGAEIARVSGLGGRIGFVGLEGLIKSASGRGRGSVGWIERLAE